MTHQRGGSLRNAGLVAGAVLIAVIALALHPHFVGHPAPQAELRQIGTLATRGRLVHGILLLLLGVLLTAFARYALHRGLTHQPVLVGLVTFAVGIYSLCTAGLIDGFIFPELGATFVSAPAAAQDAVVVTLTACSVAVNILTKFGLIAMAIAICAWSLDLVRSRGEDRVAGILGFGAAALTIAVLLVSGPFLNPHTLIVVVCAQGAWYVRIALSSAKRISETSSQFTASRGSS